MADFKEGVGELSQEQKALRWISDARGHLMGAKIKPEERAYFAANLEVAEALVGLLPPLAEQIAAMHDSSQSSQFGTIGLQIILVGRSIEIIQAQVGEFTGS